MAKGIGAMVILMTTISIVVAVIDKRSRLVSLGLVASILALIIGFANTENKPD